MFPCDLGSNDTNRPHQERLSSPASPICCFCSSWNTSAACTPERCSPCHCGRMSFKHPHIWPVLFQQQSVVSPQIFRLGEARANLTSLRFLCICILLGVLYSIRQSLLLCNSLSFLTAGMIFLRIGGSVDWQRERCCQVARLRKKRMD